MIIIYKNLNNSFRLKELSLTVWSTNSTYIDLSVINNVEIVSLVALLDDNFTLDMLCWKHGVENIGSFVFIKMGKENISFDSFRKRRCCLVIFRNDLQN